MSYTLTTDQSWSQTMGDLNVTFDRWHVSDWDVIEGGSGRQLSPAVTIYYVLRGNRITLRMDKQARAVDNLRVLYLSIESMRKNELRGLGDVMQEAYLQLGGGEKKKDPYEVFGIVRGLSLSIDDIEALYRSRVKKAHPDTGGSVEQMKELQWAYEEIKKDL